MPESPERPPVPEPEKFVRRQGLQSRLLLAATNFPSNLNVIDPKNQEVAAFEKEKIGDLDSHNYALFNRASTRERQNSAGVTKDKLQGAIQSWGDRAANILKTDKRAENLQTILGEDPAKIKGSKLIELIHRPYFAGKEDPDMHAFVKDVISKYREGDENNRTINAEALNRDMNSILWFSGLFGAQSKEVVAQLIDAEVQRELNPDSYAKTASDSVNDIKDQKTQEVLTFLAESVESVLHPVEQPEPSDKPPPERMPDGEFALREIFSMVKEEVNPDQPYFIANPVASLNLTREQMRETHSTEPFFIVGKQNEEGAWEHSPNEKVVPFVNELMPVDEQGRPLPSADQRYAAAENLTDGDSGTLALAAASANNPENQALLFHSFADSVVRIHQESFQSEKGSPLIAQWHKSQEVKEEGKPSSLDFFRRYDAEPHPTEPGKLVLREADETLIFDENGQDNLDSFKELWAKRLPILQKALADDKLNRNHIRWIEFLSHSVDTPKLWKLIRDQQPAKPKPNEAAEKPKPTVVNSVEELVSFVENGNLNETQKIALSEKGLVNILPHAILNAVVEKNPQGADLNPQVDNDPNKTMVTIDPTGNDGKGLLSAKMGINGTYMGAIPISINVDMKLRNSESLDDLLPFDIKINPDIYQKMVEENLTNYQVREMVKSYLEKKLREANSKRSIQSLSLQINPADKTVESDIGIIETNDGTTPATPSTSAS